MVYQAHPEQDTRAPSILSAVWITTVYFVAAIHFPASLPSELAILLVNILFCLASSHNVFCFCLVLDTPPCIARKGILGTALSRSPTH
ncbi:hypothetical protein BZA05DRAFT_70203 [Tricharina praecox]|uniref:uncharacterized protein n=1 Tax=Tricharina praecox TaxID=43433 RepID=UPI00221EFD66|nr:uncharacterized protein BZA05DRAFT_70203 [Tricharina praecox]KAI5850150.1 hypothetical protein BZA05DRAFT_70203 [Tricharina praecox]